MGLGLEVIYIIITMSIIKIKTMTQITYLTKTQLLECEQKYYTQQQHRPEFEFFTQETSLFRCKVTAFCHEDEEDTTENSRYSKFAKVTVKEVEDYWKTLTKDSRREWKEPHIIWLRNKRNE